MIIRTPDPELTPLSCSAACAEELFHLSAYKNEFLFRLKCLKCSRGFSLELTRIARGQWGLVNVISSHLEGCLEIAVLLSFNFHIEGLGGVLWRGL